MHPSVQTSSDFRSGLNKELSDSSSFHPPYEFSLNNHVFCIHNPENTTPPGIPLKQPYSNTIKTTQNFINYKTTPWQPKSLFLLEKN